MIDLKIKTLLTVAEEKNFTKAANKLNLTQPAVSHQIKELEDELQEQLFIRKKGDIIPTPIGDIVLNYARKFVAMHNKMLDDIKHNHKINIKLGIIKLLKLLDLILSIIRGYRLLLLLILLIIYIRWLKIMN